MALVLGRRGGESERGALRRGDGSRCKGTRESYLSVVLRWCESDGLDEDAVWTGYCRVVGVTKGVDVKWSYVGGRKLTGENQM